MSSFKKLSKSDVTVVPYHANKQWLQNYCPYPTSSDFLTIYKGTNVTGSFSRDEDPVTEGQYERLVYTQINHLFYQEYTASLNTSSLMLSLNNYESASQQRPTSSYFIYNDNANLITAFPTGALEGIRVLAINQNIYGNKVLPNHFILSSSAYYVTDDGYGNLYDTKSTKTHIGNLLYAHGLGIITNQNYQYMFPLPPIAKNNSGSFLTTDVPKTISASLNDYARSGTLNTSSIALSGSASDLLFWSTGSNNTVILTTTVVGTYTIYYTIGADIAGSCATQLRSNKAKVTATVTAPTTTSTTTTTTTVPTTTTTSTTTSTTTVPTTTTTTSTTTSTTTVPTTTTTSTTTSTTTVPTTTTSTTTTTTTLLTYYQVQMCSGGTPSGATYIINATDITPNINSFYKLNAPTVLGTMDGINCWKVISTSTATPDGNGTFGTGYANCNCGGTTTTTTTLLTCVPKAYYISNGGTFYWTDCNGIVRRDVFNTGDEICICSSNNLPVSQNGGTGYLLGGGCQCVTPTTTTTAAPTTTSTTTSTTTPAPTTTSTTTSTTTPTPTTTSTTTSTTTPTPTTTSTTTSTTTPTPTTTSTTTSTTTPAPTTTSTTTSTTTPTPTTTSTSTTTTTAAPTTTSTSTTTTTAAPTTTSTTTSTTTAAPTTTSTTTTTTTIPPTTYYVVEMCGVGTQYLMNATDVTPTIGGVYKLYSPTTLGTMNGINCWTVVSTTTLGTPDGNGTFGTNYEACESCVPTITTTSTTTSTTTAYTPSYDLYLADSYTCEYPGCSLFATSIVVALPAGTIPNIGYYFKPSTPDGHSYLIQSTTGTGPGLILLTGTYSNCNLACANIK